MDDPGYHSFMLRVWYAPEGDVWRGEVESIPSGAISTIASLEELLAVIRSSLERLHGYVPARVGSVAP